MIYEASQRTPLVELTPTSCLIRGECYQKTYQSGLSLC